MKRKSMLLIVIFVTVSVLLAVVIPKYSRDLSAAKAALDGIGSRTIIPADAGV